MNLKVDVLYLIKLVIGREIAHLSHVKKLQLEYIYFVIDVKSTDSTCCYLI